MPLTLPGASMRKMKADSLCRHKQAIVEVVRQDRREQAARSIVRNTRVQAEAENNNLLIDGHLRVPPVGDVSQAEQYGSEQSRMGYRHSQHLPGTRKASLQKGLNQPTKKNFFEMPTKTHSNTSHPMVFAGVAGVISPDPAL